MIVYDSVLLAPKRGYTFDEDIGILGPLRRVLPRGRTGGSLSRNELIKFPSPPLARSV